MPKLPPPPRTAQNRSGFCPRSHGKAKYLVGCDGGRSTIRKAAGIEFVGLDPSTSWMIAEVEMAEAPELGFRNDGFGTHALGKTEAGGAWGRADRGATGARGEPTLRELSEGLVAVFGTDFGVHSPTWISRFTDMSRQAATYRDRRVMLAGDAAHVHPPMGGQGLNTGVQDAVNLGWKLAQVVNQVSPDSLLDTYHAERHPVAERVLHNTKAQVARTSRAPLPPTFRLIGLLVRRKRRARRLRSWRAGRAAAISGKPCRGFRHR